MNRLIVAVGGGSGSGKTSFLSALREKCLPGELCVLSMDNYYLPLDAHRRDKNGVPNFDLPEGVDFEGFKRDLKALKAGDIVEKQEYVFNNPDRKPEILVFEPAPVILVEGIFIFHDPGVRELFDLTIFLHARDNLKVIRRIKRDRIERNYPLDDVLYRYENHVYPAYERFIAPYLETADIVINNNTHFSNALNLVYGFIKWQSR